MAVPDISAEVTAFRDAAYGEEVRSTLISLANKLRGVITSELNDMSTTWNNYKDDVDGHISDLDTAWDNYKDDVDGTISDLDTAWDNYKRSVNGDISGLHTAWDDYKDTVDDAISDINDDWDNYKGQISESVSYRNLYKSTIGGWIDGYYVTSDGTLAENATRKTSQLLPCIPGQTLKYVAETDKSNISGITFYDEKFNCVQTNCNVGTCGEEQTVVVPSNAYFLRLVYNSAKLNIDDVYIKNYGTTRSGLSYMLGGTKVTSDRNKLEVRNLYGSILVGSSIANNTQINDGWYSQYTPVDFIKYGCYQGDNYKYPFTAGSIWVRIPHVFKTFNIEIKVDVGYQARICYYDKNNVYAGYATLIGNDEYVAAGLYSATLESIEFCTISVKKSDGTEFDSDSTPIHIKERKINLSITDNTSDVMPISYLCRASSLWGSSYIGSKAFLNYYPDQSVFPNNCTFSCPIKFSVNDVIFYNDTDFKLTVMWYNEDDVSTYSYDSWLFSQSGLSAYQMHPSKAKTSKYVRYTFRLINQPEDASLITQEDINLRVLYKKGSSSSGHNSTIYVSESGDDAYDGSYNTPLKTVNAAIAKGAKNICIFPGVYTDQINLSGCSDLSIMSCSHDGVVLFKDNNAISVTSDTILTGYNNVHTASIDYNIPSDITLIFQDGVPDQTTLISNDDRHPSQRGQYYRCPGETKILKTTATSLNEALSEIETSQEYKWFYDNNTLYYSCPNQVSTDNPICIPRGRNLFVCDNYRSGTVSMYGIDVKYQTVNALYGAGWKFVDCKVSCVYSAGCFRYDSSLGVEFIRCEASRAQRGGNGDGFNGHSTLTGDPESHQCTCSLIDCWSHDNVDDGYSDHERSEITIIGGLYEYNGKAGITPAGGSHCRCYNVMSRHNDRGFYYTNSTLETEGGNGGQMLCHSCVAEYNTLGGGFAVSSGTATRNNSIILIDCKSNYNIYGYEVYNKCFAKMMNCSEIGSITGLWYADSKDRTTIINPSLVE